MVAPVQADLPPQQVPKSCQFRALKSARPQTTDGTQFADDPVVVLAPGRYVAMEGVRVVLRHGKKVVAAGTLDRLSTSGGVIRLAPVPGQLRVPVVQGNTTITVTGTRAALCEKREVRFVDRWYFGRPSLPVRAAPATTFVEDARAAGLKLFVRTVGGRVVRGVRATILRAGGRSLGSAAVTGDLTGGTQLDVAVGQDVSAGRYTLRLSGRPLGSSRLRTWTTPLVLGSRGAPGSPPVTQQAGLAEQRVSVDWSDSRAAGRDTAGFVAPGIGYGEIVCGVDQQHVRFYPTDVGREQSMMLWTYKDWRDGTEKAIRENVHTQFVGPSFQEGLNKWSPPDKHMTGQYEGLITDRGILDAPFGDGLAPPTSIDLRWEWDFSDPRKARCHVDAVLRTENGDPTENRPLARSLQVVWRGDPNAAGHDTVSVPVPGVGTVSLTCQASPEGVRQLTVDPATEGGSVTYREGGDDRVENVGSGPLVVALPNNGQVEIGLFGGASVMISSRWKVNDPKPGENWCETAAQVVVQ